MGLVVPAVLSASKEEFTEELARTARIPFISRVQVDVVDGKFASPANWPYVNIAELREMTTRGEMLPYLDRFEYEVDLMCFGADTVAGDWLALGATRLVFHAESSDNLPRLLASAKRRYGGGGISSLISFGLALNTTTDLALVEPCLGIIDFIQCMGIATIGRQGQPFDQRVLEKVRVLHSRHPKLPIQVDGGISLDHAKELVALGVSNLIIGSAILKSSDPAAVIAKIEALQTSFGV